MSRQGIADYLVTMRKPGENPEKVSHTNENFPVYVWQHYASPVWMDIKESDTLQRKSAREETGRAGAFLLRRSPFLPRLRRRKAGSGSGFWAGSSSFRFR
jgi:hypothetical protein